MMMLTVRSLPALLMQHRIFSSHTRLFWVSQSIGWWRRMLQSIFPSRMSVSDCRSHLHVRRGNTSTMGCELEVDWCLNSKWTHRSTDKGNYPTWNCILKDLRRTGCQFLVRTIEVRFAYILNCRVHEIIRFALEKNNVRWLWDTVQLRTCSSFSPRRNLPFLRRSLTAAIMVSMYSCWPCAWIYDGKSS